MSEVGWGGTDLSDHVGDGSIYQSETSYVAIKIDASDIVYLYGVTLSDLTDANFDFG